MTKKIRFIPNYSDTDGYIEPPVPAKSIVPEWYKKSNRFRKGNTYTMEDDNATDIKSCIPFFDALTSGYIQRTWFDIQVDSDEEHAKLKWKFDAHNTFATRAEDTAKRMTKPFYSTKDHFIFHYPYSIITPPGYSTLFTNPFNQFDSPFTALTGIVDTDTLITNGNYPIFVRKNFFGIVPSGTPILQMIPFKRDSWKSFVEDFKFFEHDLYNIGRKIAGTYGYYKKNIWKKKEYS